MGLRNKRKCAFLLLTGWSLALRLPRCVGSGPFLGSNSSFVSQCCKGVFFRHLVTSIVHYSMVSWYHAALYRCVPCGPLYMHSEHLYRQDCCPESSYMYGQIALTTFCTVHTGGALPHINLQLQSFWGTGLFLLDLSTHSFIHQAVYKVQQALKPDISSCHCEER